MLANQNKAARVGHDLNTEQFLDCIETTRTEAKFDDDFRQRQNYPKKKLITRKKRKRKQERIGKYKTKRRKNLQWQTPIAIILPLKVIKTKTSPWGKNGMSPIVV